MLSCDRAEVMYEMAGQEVSAFDPGAGQLSQLYQLMPGVMTPYQVSRMVLRVMTP